MRVIGLNRLQFHTKCFLLFSKDLSKMQRKKFKWEKKIHDTPSLPCSMVLPHCSCSLHCLQKCLSIIGLHVTTCVVFVPNSPIAPTLWNPQKQMTTCKAYRVRYNKEILRFTQPVQSRRFMVHWWCGHRSPTARPIQLTSHCCCSLGH